MQPNAFYRIASNDPIMNPIPISAARTGLLNALVACLFFVACQNDDGGGSPHPLYGDGRKAWRQTGFYSLVSRQIETQIDTITDRGGPPEDCRADDLYVFYENGDLRALDGCEPCSDQTDGAEFSSGSYAYDGGARRISFTETAGERSLFDEYVGETLFVRLLDEEQMELSYESRETFNGVETYVRADYTFERADE